mmetsp:Transcript_20290/g.43886  ORF Transcript_20290/g.43886 Transcript_20290/m.43886 type:complete len:293 (+) Transcript_20290:87-965(+)
MMDTHAFSQDVFFRGVGAMANEWHGVASHGPLEKSQMFQQEARAQNNASPPRYVQHQYQDLSYLLPPAGTDPNSCGTDSATFTVKLYQMLGRVDKDGYSHIISWQPHGRCFVIHKPELIDFILPTYFKFSMFSSFQRQLNLYGFKRITAGADKGGYYHCKFLRGRAFLVGQINRIRLKGQGHRAKANPSQEPNFWNMPPIQELPHNSSPCDNNIRMPAASFIESGSEKSEASIGNYSTDQDLDTFETMPSDTLDPTPILESARSVLQGSQISPDDCSPDARNALLEWSQLFS